MNPLTVGAKGDEVNKGAESDAFLSKGAIPPWAKGAGARPSPAQVRNFLSRLRRDSPSDWVEVVEGADGNDVASKYIVTWLEHHGNKPYGVMGLLSKKSGDGLDGYPLDCYDYWSTYGANKSITWSQFVFKDHILFFF